MDPPMPPWDQTAVAMGWGWQERDVRADLGPVKPGSVRTWLTFQRPPFLSA